MIIEGTFVLPVYVVIFVIYFRFQSIIKAMTEKVNDILSDMISETDNPVAQSDMSKRDFLLEKIKNVDQMLYLNQMLYLKGRYIINNEKLKRNISTNKLFCDNLAIKVGSKMIEQMGENSAARVGVSLAATTWYAVERVAAPVHADRLAVQQEQPPDDEETNT